GGEVGPLASPLHLVMPAGHSRRIAPLKTRAPSGILDLEVNDMSDRRHLWDICGKALGTPAEGTVPDLADDVVWKTAVSRVRAKGDERFQGEQGEMRRLGILNERGEPSSIEWPADMK